MTHEENAAMEWMNAVFMAIDWWVDADCEGSPMAQLASAYINTNDSLAERVEIFREDGTYSHMRVTDMPKFLRDSLFSEEARSMLPAIPDFLPR